MYRSRTAKAHFLYPALSLAGLFIVVAITAWGSLLSDAGENGAAAIWWPNGVLLAALLLSRRQWWVAIFVTGYLANVLPHLINHDSMAASLGLSACDMLEVAVSAYPFARDARGATSFSRPRELARLYVIGALVSPALSALCATALLHLLKEPPHPNFALNWFASNGLATIAVTPVVLSLFKRETYAIFRRDRLLESISFLLLMSLCTVLIFHQSSYPLLFLLFPPLLLMVVRLGLGGGMLGVSILGGFSIFFTLHGRGPLTLVHNISWQRQLFLIQILLASAVLCVVLVAVVLNERRLLEQAARKSEQLYRLLAENSRDIIVLTDLQHKREYVSPAVQWMMGWDPKELLGTTFEHNIVHPDDVPAMNETLNSLRNGESSRTLTYRCQKKDGSYLWMEANISLYCDRVTGDPIGYVNVVRNIAERKAAEERLQDAYLALEALAAVDALTGIANRRHFDESLAQEWRRAIRTGQPISFLLLDVDHFKLYNDLYGHLRGDSCLRQIAESTLEVVQRPGDTVACIGGEEFGIILPETDRLGALELAEKIRQTVEERALEHEAHAPGIVTVSIGCATLIPKRGSNANGLIEAADQALYDAKRGGRNRVVLAAGDPYGQMLSKE
jgi:diguanylate cyclase (GGDEF)-like protein/PAS domain S-box-containing protein